MSLENFREIDLFYQKTLFNSYENCNDKLLYPIHNYYFGFNENIVSIFDENLKLILMSDSLISNNYTNIFVSLFKERIVIQLVNNGESSLHIYNTDFSDYKTESILHQTKQIIYIWNNEPIYIEYHNQSFKLYSIENKLYYEYKLPFSIVAYSNIISFYKKIYLLANVSDNYYIYITLGDKLEYSNYFRLDYDNIRHISIDYYNDIFHIVILQHNNNVISIKKETIDSFIHYSEKILHSPIYDYILQNNTVDTNNINLNNLIHIRNNKWINEIVLDFSIIQRYTPRTINPIEISDQTSKEIPKIIYIQSNKYFDYFKWIIDNYDTSENETVIFYNYLQFNITIEFIDNFLIQTLNMLDISNNIKIYILTMGKLMLSDGSIYKRSFKKTKMNENVIINAISNENNNDFYIKTNQITQYDLSKILFFLISNNIKYSRYLYWTPFQYYKLDMKLIWNRSKEYWQKIYNLLNKDLSYENYMPYLFYNIING